MAFAGYANSDFLFDATATTSVDVVIPLPDGTGADKVFLSGMNITYSQPLPANTTMTINVAITASSGGDHPTVTATITVWFEQTVPSVNFNGNVYAVLLEP